MHTATATPLPRIGLYDLYKHRHRAFDALTKLPLRHPQAVLFKVPGLSIHFVHSPDMAKHILQHNALNYKKDYGYELLALGLGNGLITNNDFKHWRKQRTILQPPFHRESLANMCRIVTDSTEQLFEQWKSRVNTEINFTREMASLTSDIVSQTLFTSDITPQQVSMVWEGINHLNQVISDMALNPFSLPWKFPLPRYVKARKYIAEMDELIYGIIERRRKDPNPPHDLLQMLLETRYDDGSPMPDKQIRDEIVTVFVAGHETTVNALSWTWYLLKQHPQAEDKLREESARFADATPGFANVAELNYGRCVMNEVMRLYPPVENIGREVIADDEVCGHTLRAGNNIAINIAGLHHHPEYWQNPAVFTPERFESFDIKGDNRFVFMPFGAGPRICIGNNFAMIEMQLINALLSARVNMELVSRDVTPVPLITLKPGNGIIMRLKAVK